MNDQPQPSQPQQPPTPPLPPASETVPTPSQQPTMFVSETPGTSTPPSPSNPSAQPGHVYQQPGQPGYHQGSSPQHVIVAKDKTVAVLLAVFLGFWTWLYTYQKDAKKFWINLGLSVITLGLWAIIGWIWSIIDTATKPESYYLNYYHQQ